MLVRACGFDSHWPHQKEGLLWISKILKKLEKNFRNIFGLDGAEVRLSRRKEKVLTQENKNIKKICGISAAG